MTRTERAMSPRALVKDRSLSKSGMDKSFRKSGNGAHNWGADTTLFDSLDDTTFEHDQDATTPTIVEANRDRRESVGSSSSPSSHEDDKEKALAFRTKTWKKNKSLDLGSIARTSSAVASPISPK